MEVRVDINGVTYTHRTPGPWKVNDFGYGCFKNIVNSSGINCGRFPLTPGATMFFDVSVADAFCAELNKLYGKD